MPELERQSQDQIFTALDGLNYDSFKQFEQILSEKYKPLSCDQDVSQPKEPLNDYIPQI